MKQMVDIVREHPFFKDLSSDQIRYIAGCGKNVVFKENEVIAKPGDMANDFYLIRQGHVSLSLDVASGKPFVFQTLSNNDILGLSWLIPPYHWTVTARAIETTHAIALDGSCLRRKCEEETSLGFKMMKHIAQILVMREDALRLHLLDVYGKS